MSRHVFSPYQPLGTDTNTDDVHATGYVFHDLEYSRLVNAEASSESFPPLIREHSGTTSDDEEAETYHTPLTASRLADPTWLPYTLRWIPLSLIIALYLVLEIAVIVVHAVSSRNYGLVTDDGSSAIAVGTKFVPTLLAVVSGLLATILLDDVKRTEPFARLATPSGTTAGLALTWAADTWWSALYRSWPSPLSGAKWALPCTTIAFVLGFLAVSPLSSALFISQDVILSETARFSQLDLNSSLPIQPAPIATTYFRTISNVLRNLSTSAWITDDYVVLPFWPDGISTVPLAPILPQGNRKWSAYTTIFSLDLDCEPMHQRWDSPPPPTNRGSTNLSLALVSPTGCTLKLDLGNSSLFYAPPGEIWSGISNLTNTLERAGLNEDNSATIFGCTGDEMLISTTEGNYGFYGTNRTDFIVTGQICRNTYYVGYSTATAFLENGQSVVTINATEYHESRMPIPAETANSTAFDNVFFDSNWTVHLDAGRFSSGDLGFDSFYSTGPANLLSALYTFSTEEMIADVSIETKMQRIRRQFFAEILRTNFDLKTTKDVSETSGSVSTTSRRIVVVPSVAIALEVLIIVQAILIVVVLYLTRLSRRPLGLTEDPAPIISFARLISYSPTIRSIFGRQNITQNSASPVLSNFRFQLNNGQIEARPVTTPVVGIESKPADNKVLASRSAGDDKEPNYFPFWAIAMLFVVLVATLVAIAILYRLSMSRGLYQTVFVYNIDISVRGKSFGQVNPASIITTFIAIIIGLWWGSFETTLRRVQPYLALAEGPVSGDKGVAVSYRSSYLMWSSIRAMRRKHWLLFLLSTGASLSEILTIAMSSLWNRAPGTLPDTTSVPRTLELRHVPMVSTVQLAVSPSSPDSSASLLGTIFSNISTSWIYGATTQLSLEGPEPSWSLEGWSFVPTDLSGISLQSPQHIGNTTANAKLSANVTMTTPAVRARLECSPYDFIDDTDLWLTKWDLTNMDVWNTSINPVDLKTGYELVYSTIRHTNQ
ncbi:hypothetical protein GGR51DRAFT_544538 [Nemania sp. FL0031]|nr:hypothetical protein GGR51DRAFT_544538 [Nemania sp. FL0031]